MSDRNGAASSRGSLLHARATQVLSVAMVLIGLGLVAQLTPLSVILGVLFVAAGVGRLYVGARMRRGREGRPGA